MYSVDGPNKSGALPAPAAAGGGGFFQATASPGTIFTPDWGNMVQGELLAILAAADIAPSKTTYNQVLTSIMALTGAASAAAIAAALAAYAPPAVGVLWLRNQQVSGTGGGEELAEGWNQRVLNLAVANTIAGASLAANQFTLPAGTYEISAQSQAELTTDGVLTHRLRVRDITAAATLIAGVNGQAFQSADLPVLTAVLQGRFVLGAAHVLELDSWVEAAATAGAYTSTGEVEVYSDVYIRKVA